MSSYLCAEPEGSRSHDRFEFIRLYMCPHTAIYIYIYIYMSSRSHDRFEFIRPLYRSMRTYICVLILLFIYIYICPRTCVRNRKDLEVTTTSNSYVTIRLYMCPHTAIYIYVSSYLCAEPEGSRSHDRFEFIRLYMCPHTAIYIYIYILVPACGTGRISR
jgi:hypothetical protein